LRDPAERDAHGRRGRKHSVMAVRAAATSFDPKEVASQPPSQPVEIPLDIIARPKKSEAPKA
jgi:predicted RecB family nuclease